MHNLLSEFHAACRTIRGERGKKALNYAVSYAEAGLDMSDPHEAQVQCLYILNNITHWRGPIATAARDTFKRLAKPASWKEAA